VDKGLILIAFAVLSVLLFGLGLGLLRRQLLQKPPEGTALVLVTPKGGRTAHLGSALVIPNWHRVERVDLRPKTLRFPVSRSLDGVQIKFDLEIDVGIDTSPNSILAAAREVGTSSTFNVAKLTEQLQGPIIEAAGAALENELQAFLGSIDLGTPDRMRALPALEALLRGAVTAILPAGYRLHALRTTSYDGV
jgi:uncharacterized membrane protein YqiK